MPNRFFLNALREGERTLPEPNPGGWKDDSQDGGFLTKYANDIYIKGKLGDSRMAHSVPSVYERPILFQQSFNDRHSPLHAAVLGEWRGLLAVVALRNWYNYALTFTPYDVAALDPDASSAVGDQGQGNLHLKTILRHQLPQGNDWNRWYLIHCEGKLIGATSPWTMVYTPAQYEAPNGVYWRDVHGVLYDPIDLFDPGRTGNPDELWLLRQWVELVLNNKEWGMPTQRHASAVSSQLQAWLGDLSRYRQDRLRVSKLSDHTEIAAPPFRDFLRFGESVSADGSSELLIKSRRLGSQKVLAFTRQALNPDLRAWGPVLVGQIDLAVLRGPNGDEFQTKGGKRYPVAYVIAEEAFFPPKLVEMGISAEGLSRGPNKYALPLTPKFFEYFDHDDLVDFGQMLEYSETEREVIVQLRIPLHGGPPVKVTKKYNRQTDIVTLDDGAPSLGVWPDFYAEDWEENYAACAGPQEASPKEDFRVAPLLAGGQKLAESRNDGTQRAVRIWKCVQPPIGFALTFRNPGLNETFEVGVVLRDRLLAPVSPVDSRAWDVSVDFGTSNTMMMVKKNLEPEPVLLELAGRLRFLTSAVSDRQEAISNTLYPEDGAKPPFRTLLYRREATIIGDTQADYTLRFKYFPEERNEPLPNVKWGSSGGTDTQEPLREYLRGLVRYIVCEARAEGVTTLNLRWSYPLSLPESSYQAMRNFWLNTGALFSRGRMTVSASEPVSESEAVSRCLAARVSGLLNLRADGLTVAVDVGGGSTDFGFWSAKNLVDQLSFKVAGNDILCPEWMQLPDYLTSLHRAAMNGTDIPHTHVARAGSRAVIYVNDLLARAKTQDGQVFMGADPQRHPVPLAIFGGSNAASPWLHLRTMVYIFFAGLSYYAGLHSRRLLTEVHDVRVYLGGRAASLLTWLTNDPVKLHEVLVDAFQIGVNRRDDDAPGRPVTVKFEGLPVRFIPRLPPVKYEVALGMLDPALSGKVARKTATCIGELNWRLPDGQVVPWDRPVNASEMAILRPPADRQNCYYMEFLHSVLTRHEELNLDMENIGRLDVGISAIQEQLQIGAEPSAQILQPVFACELKALMGRYVELVTESARLAASQV